MLLKIRCLTTWGTTKEIMAKAQVYHNSLSWCLILFQLLTFMCLSQF